MASSEVSPDSALLDAARDVAQRAYAPYSNFSVGAALRTTGGEQIVGCNVENAAYGEAICAERNAVTTAVAQLGAQGFSIETIAIIGLSGPMLFPCGACRQVLREFHCQRVVVEKHDGEPLAFDFADLLPMSFGPENLNTSKNEA